MSDRRPGEASNCLPTDMAEVPAWLRARCDEHTSVYDIVVYGRPETWLAIAEVLSCAQSTGAGVEDDVRKRLLRYADDLDLTERPALGEYDVTADIRALCAALAAMPARLECIEDVPCRFGCEAATRIYYVPKGCACWSDPVQALCEQHAIKAQSEGPITLIARVRNGCGGDG